MQSYNPTRTHFRTHEVFAVTVTNTLNNAVSSHADSSIAPRLRELTAVRKAMFLVRSALALAGQYEPRLAELCVASLIVFWLSVPATLRAQEANYTQAESLIRNHQWDEGLAIVLRLLKHDPNNPRELNLAGLALTGKGSTEEANKYFTKCLLASPNFVPALKNLAINEYNLHDYGSAEKHLLMAAERSPADPIINLYLGEIAFRHHQYGRAADALSRSQEFASRNSNVGAHLAISYLQTGEKEKASDVLEHLVLDQVDVDSQFLLGITLSQQGMPEKAIPFLVAVQQRVPDSYDVGFDLVLTYTNAKQYARAIETGKALISRGRETAELDNLLAESYEANNETQQAVDVLRRAIALDPQDESNYLDFASLCMNHRSYEAAAKVLSVGLETHPRSESLTFMRGVLYGMQDEYELAEKDFEKAAELAPQNDLGMVGLGVTYLEKGNAAAAIKVLRARLREKPNDASLLYLLAEALLRNGAIAGSPDYVDAQKSLEKSVRLNPDLCLPHVSLGSIYIDEERFSEAAEQLEQARRIDPTERSAYSHLAIAYRRMNQPEKSKEVLTSLRNMIEQERRSTREKLKSASQMEPGSDGSKTEP